MEAEEEEINPLLKVLPLKALPPKVLPLLQKQRRRPLLSKEVAVVAADSCHAWATSQVVSERSQAVFLAWSDRWLVAAF